MKHIFKQFVAVPMVSVSMLSNLLPSFTVAPDKTQELPINNYQLTIKLDTNSPVPVTSEVYKPVITPGKSLAQEREEELQKLAQQAKSQKRDVAPRDVVRTSDPGLETKRALVKEVAREKGIDWKILEAVWQVETGKSWDTAVRSGAGATGPMQFMAGTFRKYRDSEAASIYDAQDAVAAAANLLKASGLDRGDVRSALLSYNHADWYVAKVKKVADSIVE